MNVLNMQDNEDGGATIEFECSQEELVYLARHGLKYLIADKCGMLKNYSKMKDALRMYADAGYATAKKTLEECNEI
jgi:hypothetical protein